MPARQSSAGSRGGGVGVCCGGVGRRSARRVSGQGAALRCGQRRLITRAVDAERGGREEHLGVLLTEDRRHTHAHAEPGRQQPDTPALGNQGSGGVELERLRPVLGGAAAGHLEQQPVNRGSVTGGEAEVAVAELGDDPREVDVDEPVVVEQSGVGVVVVLPHSRQAGGRWRADGPCGDDSGCGHDGRARQGGDDHDRRDEFHGGALSFGVGSAGGLHS